MMIGVFFKAIFSFLRDPFGSLSDRIKDMPFYKIFGIAFPEMLISIYSISILISLVIGLEKGGIRGIRSFLGWVHFYTLDAPIGGFVKWITEQDKSFIVLFSAILIFVFTSSLSYYLRDSLSRISSLNKQKIASVSNSSYMLIFSVFASIDYANLINHEVGFILTCFFVSISLIWVSLYCLSNWSKLTDARSKWNDVREEWHKDVKLWLFVILSVFFPLAISVFAPLILMFYILVGLLDVPSGGAVLFNGTKESREKKRKEIEKSLDKLKENLYERYRGDSNYRAKVRAAIQVAGKDSKIVPVFSGENVADIVRYTLKNELARPLIIVTEVDGEIYTYTIQ